MRKLVCVACLFFFACAQVPKESVELSTTVGRDIAEAHRSHRATAELLFARMEGDINRFIDDVYLPYQIENTLGPLKPLMFRAISDATKSDATDESKKVALKLLKSYVTKVQRQVEKYRAELLGRIQDQKKEVFTAIDGHYNQLHYANSIVTGHLASVAKVHDAQKEILEKFGFEDLRGTVGTELADVSVQLGKIVDKAERGEQKLEDARVALEKLLKKNETEGNEAPADAGSGNG